MIQTKLKKTTILTKQAGFTIVEVMLYLGIVGLVLLIAFSNLGGRTRETQFTDSMRSLNDFITGEYNQLVNGVKNSNSSCSYGPVPGLVTITPPAIPPVADPSCVLFGKVIIFGNGEGANATTNKSVIKSYDLVGRNVRDTDFGDIVKNPTCHSTNFSCVNPAIINTPGKSYTIPWGLEFVRGTESKTLASPDTAVVSGIGFLREPSGRNITTVVFSESVTGANLTGGPTNGNPAYFAASSNTIFGNQSNAAFCFGQPGGGKVAAITLGGNESERQVTSINFSEEVVGSYDCN